MHLVGRISSWLLTEIVWTSFLPHSASGLIQHSCPLTCYRLEEERRVEWFEEKHKLQEREAELQEKYSQAKHRMEKASLAQKKVIVILCCLLWCTELQIYFWFGVQSDTAQILHFLLLFPPLSTKYLKDHIVSVKIIIIIQSCWNPYWFIQIFIFFLLMSGLSL